MRADIAKWPAAKRNRPAAKKYDIRGFVKSYKGGQFFFLSGLSFTKIHESQDCRGRGGGVHFFNSSLPLPPTSQTLRH